MQGELPFSSTVEFVVRAGYRARRLVDPPRGDSLPEIIVSRKMGLLCAAIPLCGTLTLKRLFLTNREVNFEAELLRDTVPNVLRSRLCGERPLLLTVVRNPWSRVVSCYEKKIRAAYTKRYYKGIALISGYDGLSSRMSFDAFVEWLCADEGRDDVANRHWMSQHRFLPLSEIESGSLKVLRLESIERDLNCALAHLKLPYQTVKKTNSSATKTLGRLHETTKEYYTRSTINAIGDRYARDIELFEYQF